MKDIRDISNLIKGKEIFSRNEFLNAMSNQYGLTDPQSAYELQKHLNDGSIIRIGWNQYSMPMKRVYSHSYSESAVAVVNMIEKEYVNAVFQVVELTQLNDFMNHLVAHNTIFVSVENNLVDFVFDSLWKAYPGRVMLKPNADHYYRYLQEDTIIVQRLPSEAPKGYGKPWQSRLEKILVDIFTDKLISGIVPESEKRAIMDEAFQEYYIDENTMIRYAKRKGAEKKMNQVLHDYKKVAGQ